MSSNLSTDGTSPNKWVKIWLMTGILMVFFQIIIGGVTRLTGSGLSITKWEIVTGTLPPLNQEEWDFAFELYKATPQYEKINEGMSLSDFKFIYFWEYFHRLWARILGFVFLIPFIIFLSKKCLSPPLIRRLLILVGLGMLVAVFGWIMVKSGLSDRPWVSAYKLSMHLILALIVYSYLFVIYLDYVDARPRFKNKSLRSFANVFLGLLFIQIILGAWMSGMHAGLLYPTWPKMGSVWFPDALLSLKNYVSSDFWHYDINPFIKTLVQFAHRAVAYFLVGFGIYGYLKLGKKDVDNMLITEKNLFISLLLLQVLLGILTIIACKGGIPVFLGSIHQAMAILLLSAVLMLRSRIINN